LSAKSADGLNHHTDEGLASWYDFAVTNREEALASGFPVKAGRVITITTTDHPTSARRTHYSVLDKTRTHVSIEVGRHWREAMRETKEKIAHS
jgi:dTDP-4-dehydrorhamnose reductase